VLVSRRDNLVGQTGIAYDATGRQAHSAGGSDDAAAPIAEDVTIRGDRHGRVGGQIIGRDDVGRSGEMGS
jgi:hypothetical protein